MIRHTIEQFEKCVEIWNNSDSAIDAADDIKRLLNLKDGDYTPDEWSEFARDIVNAAANQAPIEAVEAHQTMSELPPNVARMYELCDNVASTYERKNADYGDSFGISIKKYGIIAALTRMSDKWNRLENLILKGESKVTDEAVTDTLIDLAAYALMTVMELEK